MSVLGFDLRKYMAVMVVAVLFFLSAGCKETEFEKNEKLVKAALPGIVQQKDSLNTQVQEVQKEFQGLKSKIDAVPEAVLKQPEYSAVAEMVETLEKKHTSIESVIPAIEAKLKALEDSSQKSPTAEVEHEITVLKQTLEAQRNRMDNYVMNYRKLSAQLDSIQTNQK